MSEEQIHTIRNSQDPKEIAAAATQLARSDAQADQQALRLALENAEVLGRLNTEEEYAGDVRGLRLVRIMDALEGNESPLARETLLGLTQSPAYTQEIARVDLLVDATEGIRPAPPALVAFWDRYSEPDDDFSSSTISVMIENGSEPALALFERKLTSSGHEFEDKQEWLRSEVMTHRDEPAVLRSCDRLLRGGLSPDLKSELIDVIFDYQPELWFTAAVNYIPPEPEAFSPDAIELTRALARYALAIPALSEKQREAIGETLSELDEREGSGG